MQKKWKWLLGIVTALVILVVTVSVAGPHAILALVKQPAPAESYNYSTSFRTTYDETRQGIEALIAHLEGEGIAVERESHAVDADDGLYIDTFYLPSAKERTNLVVLTTGVHGMEGYIGSVMLDVFFQEIYPQLDREDTGVLVVANVNPYGMKYYRRYNENNVDLNRNFILDWDAHDRNSNTEYPKVDTFLGPTGKIGNAFWHEVGFYGSLAKTALTEGADTVSDALLTGQYAYPQGVYYGGDGDEKSTVYLKDVFSRCLDSEYDNIVHIDIHSGYGPRYNMVIFNSVYETMNEAQPTDAFGYDYVLSYDSEGFYATTGDTTDFFYRLAQQKETQNELFSTCFEFGTIGDDFLDSILSLKYTVDENRQHWYPTGNKLSAQIVKENYFELYYPTETAWREKTVEDFVTAAQGVLNTKLK